MYKANNNRYDEIVYNTLGFSGVKLPPISLGLWHNFGDTTTLESQKEILFYAFDNGIIHWDLANNYGPPYGSAESNCGRIIAQNFKSYRDELIISSKAGFDMHPGPYGIGGSKKYLISSLDASLGRLGLDYVDIFYHHVQDDSVPIYETSDALAQIIRSGKALYVGVSNYSPKATREIYAELAKHNIKPIVNQVKYSMLWREPENELFDTLDDLGMGAVIYSPLAQGLLSSRYINKQIPDNSRAALNHFLKQESINEQYFNMVTELSAIASVRSQDVSQLALAWVLRRKTVTSAIVGVSTKNQLIDNLTVMKNINLSDDEISRIDNIVKNYQA